MTKTVPPKVKIVKGKTFGDFYDIERHIPADCDLIVVCRNDGGGYVPVACLLPHQVYVKEFNLPGLTILPVRSKEHVEVNEIRETRRVRAT